MIAIRIPGAADREVEIAEAKRLARKHPEALVQDASGAWVPADKVIPFVRAKNGIVGV